MSPRNHIPILVEEMNSHKYKFISKKYKAQSNGKSREKTIKLVSEDNQEYSESSHRTMWTQQHL